METELLEIIKKSALSMDAADIKWLKKNQIPTFNSTIYGEEGTNLLLLHGLLGAVSNWNDTIPLFSKYSKVHGFEFPIINGHRSEVNVKSLTAYTELYIRKNNLKPLVLCGNSLGGHVALRIALSAPELVGGLILSGSSGLYERSADKLPLRPSRTYIKKLMADVFYKQEFVTDEAVEDIYKLICDKSYLLNIIHAAKSAKKDNLLDRLSEINIPTLLIWGEDDTVTSMEVAEIFNKHLPNSELVTVKNCGHAPMIEYPELFSSEVEKFLLKNNLK